MSSRSILALVAALAGAPLAACTPTDPQDLWKAGPRFEVDLAGKRHAMTGGAIVTARGALRKDLWLAAAIGTIDADIGDDVHAYAASLEVRGRIGGDLSVRAARVLVDAPIGEDLVVFAVETEVGPDATIAGNTELFSHKVVYRGATTGRIEIKASEVTFAGAAAGPIEIVAPRVTIASGARLVAGASIYTIGEPVIEPGAVIDGKIAVHPIHDARGFAPPAPGAFLGDLMLALGLAASGLVAGLLWLFAGRGSVERTIDNLVEHAGRSAVNGILTVVGIPALIALMVLTVIGIPFAAVLALAVPLLLLLAVAGAGYGIGEFLFNRLGEPRSPGARVLMLFAGLLVLGLVSLIPWAGPALVGAAVVVGLGALIAALRTQLG